MYYNMDRLPSLQINPSPLDNTMRVNAAFQRSSIPNKITLSVGAYRTSDGAPYHFKCVQEAKKIIATLPSEYVPMQGNQSYLEETTKLFLGENTHYQTVQTLSGTGALKLCAEFLKETLDAPTIYIPSPTWGNHRAIFASENINIMEYPYLDANSNFHATQTIEAIRNIPPQNIILLHACAHNPTGYDFTAPQWNEIIQICRDHQHIVVMDMAYMGFASGNIEEDLIAVRLLNAAKIPSFICTTFSKNMGLYGERIGNLFFYNDQTDATASLLKTIIRRSYSNPPINGAKIVSTILKTPRLKELWIKELHDIHRDYATKRRSLREKFERAFDGDFGDITKQRGMFYFSKITDGQNVEFQKRGIFFPGNRISLAGINGSNIDRFVETWVDITAGTTI